MENSSTYYTTRDFPIDRLPRPLAVVCHDAGGANIISAGLEGHLSGLRVFVAGPAYSIFCARFPGLDITHDVEEAIGGSCALLSGTGWASDVEHRARQFAADKCMMSVAVLDHWVNYRSRFTRDGIEILPDRIWVTDDHARAKAINVFGPSKVDLVGNPYMREQLESIAAVHVTSTVVLYILEPLQSDWGRSTPGEFQALDFLSKCFLT